MNKVILVGNISRTPELKTGTTKDGREWANLKFNVVTSEKTKDGYLNEYHRCSWFGTRAQSMSQYIKEGEPFYVEGKLATRKWKDKAGVEKYSTEIEVNDVKFLPKAFTPEYGRSVGGQVSEVANNESDVF